MTCKYYGCTSLTSITIPNSVTSIGSNTFSKCTNLISVTLESNSFVSTPQNNYNSIKSIFGEQVKTYVIGKEVTSIGNHVFSGCTNLTSVTIPNSVISIGNGGFYGCCGLTSITIPSSVTSIGSEAFYNCSSLTSVHITDIAKWCKILFDDTSANPLANAQHLYLNDQEITDLVIPSGVTSIGSSTFYKCSSLTSVSIPNSVTSIGNEAFCCCSGLTSVTIPNSVTSIGNNTFGSCSGLTSVTIPNSVTSIGTQAFQYCSSLTSITIPNSVTSIGTTVFNSCRNLTSILVESGNSVYDSRNNCNAIIETETNKLIVGCQNTIIPNTVTSIGDDAFRNCYELTSVTIPNSVTSIGNHAFIQCSGLTSITIPNSVTSIGFEAFYGCMSLTSITIGNNVTSIGSQAFQHCSSLITVKVDLETPLAITVNTFSNRTNATLVVPKGCKSAYEDAEYWREFKSILEEPDVITIGSSGYATYCSSYPLDFSEVSGMKAYIASGFSPSTGRLVLTRVTEVPAGEGLYLVGEAGTYEVAIAETDMFYSNLLKGVTSATTINPTDGSYTNFILANGSHGIAFYSLSEAGQLAAGKAYLQLPTAIVPEVKAINVIFDDDNEDGISRPTPAPSRNGGEVYNLQGQKVSVPKSGLYIINGKKMFIK